MSKVTGEISLKEYIERVPEGHRIRREYEAQMKNLEGLLEENTDMLGKLLEHGIIRIGDFDDR